MPYYERVKETEMEAGGAALDQSRPLMTDQRRVTFATSTLPMRPNTHT